MADEDEEYSRVAAPSFVTSESGTGFNAGARRAGRGWAQPESLFSKNVKFCIKCGKGTAKADRDTCKECGASDG